MITSRSTCISAAVLLAVSAAWCAADTGAPASAQPLTAQDVLALRRVSDPQISPSGARVAFVVGGLVEGRGEESDLWMVAPDGSGLTQLTTAEGGESSPRWSPDGQALAYVARAEGKSEIRVFTLKDRSTKVVPGSSGTTDLAWSPDGRTLALRKPDPLDEEMRARRQKGDDAWRVGEQAPHVGLWLLELESGRGHRLSPPGWTVWSYTWSPKGGAIAALASQDATAEGQEYQSSLVLYDVATGSARTVTTRTNPHAAPSFSPDGTELAYLGPIGDFRERGTIHIVAVRGGEPRSLLASYKGNVWDVRWHPREPWLLAAIQRGAEHALCRVSPSGEVRDIAPMRHALTPYWDDCFTVSADGTRAAFISEQDGADLELWSAKSDGSEVRRLTSFNDALLARGLGAVEAVRWRNERDALDLEGVLVKPANFKAGTRYPLVVWLHGGPAYGWGLGGQVRSWAQLFAANGYLVFLPNFRGSAGYGLGFLGANVRDWGTGPLSDVLSGVDHVVAKGIADRERLFIGGGSYGGYLTFWALTQTAMFKAAFVRAGVADLASEFATTDEPTFEIGYFRSTPYDDPEFYRANSPVEHAAKVKTPLLVVHGERDLRVPLGQGLQFRSALAHFNVPVEMLVYPREGHSIREYAHQVDVMTRMLAWYRRWDNAAGSQPAK